jgi:hypothetical protein
MKKMLLKKSKLQPVVVNGVGKVDDCLGPCTCRGVMCLTSVLICTGIAFSPYIVAVVGCMHVM